MWSIQQASILCTDGDRRASYSFPSTSRYVSAIVTDLWDRAWFGTDKGVSCFDGETWRTWTTDDFLAGNVVTSLAVDLDGSIWVGTTTGVSHIVLVEDAGAAELPSSKTESAPEAQK